MNSQGKGLWSSMVVLNQAVTRAINAGASQGPSTEALDAANDLDVVLLRHRGSFMCLLENPKKNSSERSTLLHAVNEAVTLPGFSVPTKLPDSFVQETLILSDMFDINEMSAFSLLRSAEEERTLYPGIPRGLVAVLFYYDSREQLANAFKSLLQARQGISWTLMPNNEELSVAITRYLSLILNDYIADRILELISSMDLTKEIDLLQKNRALGDSKHRSMVIEKFKSVRFLLSEAMFCWSAQTPLKKEICLKLLTHLSKVKLSETKDGSLDKVNLAILFALLYSLDASYLLSTEDVAGSVFHFPLTNDYTFIPEVHKRIKEGKWESKGLMAVVQLSWAVTLSSLRQLTSSISDKEAFIEEDEVILNEALKGRAFYFIEKCILASDNLPLDSFYCQRLHGMLSDFIYYMFDRVKMMKTKADENARHILTNLREGLEAPPNTDQSYEDLLNCLAALYNGSQCGDLVEEFWYDGLYTPGTGHSQSSRQMALYRFVRLPGDFLLPTMFVPYVNFLAGISNSPRAAQNTYNFLRMNSQPPAQGSNLSWDNFLNAFSQYYNNLRAQHPQSMHETVYRSSRSGLRCISPQELQGLISVLKLLTVVSLQDESAKIAICDNTSWSPIFVFTGLLTCSVPLSLKTGLLKALAAFSQSPTLGDRVWVAIQSANLVPSHVGTPGYSSRGLKQDIEEVESSSEEFPLSQAILELMLSLVRAGIPYQLGNITVPGFRPFYDLVKDHIFLPHDSRTYKQAGERWALSQRSLKFFLQMLDDYQPPPANLPPGEAWNHPSHMLLVDLAHDSTLFRQILSILHDGVSILMQHSTVPGMEDLKDTLLSILKLILKTHQLQNHVFTRELKGEILFMSIDKLLQTMNQRSGLCDHLLNVAQLLGHHATIPLHAAYACDVLKLIGSTTSGQNHLLPLLAAPPRATIFRQNFVQLLDHANLDEEHTQAAESALNLLKGCLELPSPNIAHFLLGFTDGASITNSELRSDLLEPGVRGFPRTALHSVLTALPSLSPKLLEAAHSLIFMLTSSPATSAATLRYLSSHDFVHQCLTNLSSSIGDSPSKLLSTGWMLRIAALDLRYHSSHKQRSQLRRLINLLVMGSDPEPDIPTEPLGSTLTWTSGSPQGGRVILLSLLESTELTVEAPSPLQSQYQARIPPLLRACEEVIDGVKVTNLSMLHKLLCQIIQDAGSTTGNVSQNDPVDNDIQNILDYALALNQSRRMLAAQKHFLESWRQLVEVVVAVSPAELTDISSHQAFLHTLTLDLTRRLLDETSLPELTSILVSTLLLLVTTLRTLHSRSPIPKSLGKESALESAPQLPSSLQLILKNIVDCLLRFKQGSQSVRASLYSSLLNYLRICANHSPYESLKPVINISRETAEEQFHRENYDFIREDLPQLVDILCCEAAAGHIICRLLSLTCLDALASLERRSIAMAATLAADSPLLSHISEQGHLQRLLDSVLIDDQNLMKLINEGSHDLRPLYQWEARASLLTRFSLTPGGARLLLQAGMMSRLSEMQIFKLHPSEAVENPFSSTETGDSTLSQIFDSAITGAIRICMGVLTSLGSNDDSAVSQTLQFLSANVDSFAESLRVPRTPNIGLLNQLSLLTSIVAGASPPSLYSDMRDPSALHTAAQTRRLRKQLLSLLPHFLPDGHLAKVIEDFPEINEDGISLKETSKTSLLNVFVNCLVHVRDHLLQGDPTSSVISLPFQPSMDGFDSKTPGRKTLNLGTLFLSLDQSSLELMKVRTKRESASTNLHEIETSQYDFIRKFVSASLLSTASPTTVRKLAAIHLQNIINQYRKQEEMCVLAVEASMLLLFRHLEYYLTPHSKLGINKENIEKNTSSMMTPLSAQQIQDLKNRARSIFEEILPRIKQVDDLYSKSSSHVPFMEGCITRIKWLIAS